MSYHGDLNIVTSEYYDHEWHSQEHHQEVMRTSLGTNIVPPVRNVLIEGGSLLDVGSGRCFWLYEVAEEFPNSHCVGIDIRPIPKGDRRDDLTNVELHTGDVVKGLPFQADSFDLVSMRTTLGHFKLEEYFDLISEILRVLKPGGWVQLLEAGSPTRTGHNLEELWRKLQLFMQLRDMDCDLADFMEGYVKEAGFSPASIRRRLVPVPLGTWGGEIGRLTFNSFLDSITACKPMMVQLMGETSDDLDRLLRALRAECTSMRSFLNIHVVTAAKPGKRN